MSMQGVFGVWVITWRTASIAVITAGLLLLLAAAAATPELSDQLPPPRAFLLILLSPLVVVLWSGFNWAADEALGGNRIGWRSVVHTALALGCVLIALLTPYVFRHSPKWWLLVPCSLTAIVCTAAAWFVGAMAIVNDWL